MKITIIKGPIVPQAAGNIVYQITLTSGMIITNPAAFGPQSDTTVPVPAIVGENGQVLTKQGLWDVIKRVNGEVQPCQALS